MSVGSGVLMNVLDCLLSISNNFKFLIVHLDINIIEYTIHMFINKV
jgi:hypothetical protein